MKRKLKQAVSVLIAVIMLAVIIPVTAAAAEIPRDVCVFLPYEGTDEDNFMGLAELGVKVRNITGGELVTYQRSMATIDNLADALETCGVVIIGTHGGTGRIGVYSDGTDLTDEEKTNNENWGNNIWGVDGQTIVKHMTKDAPDNLVFSTSCKAMESDGLCKPLRDKGVAAIYGFSKSASGPYGIAAAQTFMKYMGLGEMVSEAFVDSKKELGCDWDIFYDHYTLQQAIDGKVAFPVVVSHQDPYPGEDKVDGIQTVNSDWLLPLRTDQPVKYVFALGEYVNPKPVYDNNIKSAEGALPDGMGFTVTNGRLFFFGTPETKGFMESKFKIVTEDDETFEKTVDILVVDYDNAEVLPKESVTWISEDWGSNMNNSYAFDDHEEKYSLDLDYTTAGGWIDDWTYDVQTSEGHVPYMLEYFGAPERGHVTVQSALVTAKTAHMGRHFTMWPGEYEFTLDVLTSKGNVFRKPVHITVQSPYEMVDFTSVTEAINLKRGKNVERRILMDPGDSESERWPAARIMDIEITDGRLPKGLQLTNSWEQPLGFYGAAEEAGEFEITFLITAYNNVYKYTYEVRVDDDIYYVDFDANGGTGTMETINVNKGEKVTLPENEFKRDYYVFTGWDKGAVGDEVELTGDLTVKALWRKAQVTFHNNDGTAVKTTLDVDDTGHVVFPSVSREGYDLEGWGNESGTIMIEEGYAFTEDTELYAMWKEEGSGTVIPGQATITFDADGGTLVGTQSVKIGEKAAKPADPKKPGYVFDGWYLDGAEFDFNTSLTKDITLKAKWKASTAPVNVTVSFDSDGGSAVASQTVLSGEKAVKPADPTKAGYTFDGWYLGGTEFDFNTAVTADMTLTAKWTASTTPPAPATWNVTFDTGGGSSVAAQTVADGNTAVKPADPARSGYKFDGWYEDASLTSAFDFTTPITADITLYAKWTKGSSGGGGGGGSSVYVLTYVANGGTAIGSETYTVGTKVALDKIPAREGYTFTGWFADKELTEKITSIEMDSAKKVYAGWKDASSPGGETAGYPLIEVTIGSTKYKLNGMDMEMDAAPFIDENDRTMLPVRVIANALGISDNDIAWDNDNKTARFTRPDGKAVSCTVGSNIIMIGSERIKIDSEPVIVNSRIFLPMRALFNAFNVSDDNIIWNGAERTVTVLREALEDIEALKAE